MESKEIKAHFESEGTVNYYARAASELGLWVTEEKIFTRLYKRDDSILELGCGAGRVAFGLYELGYRNLLATDFSSAMIKRARNLSTILEYPVPFRVCDAIKLEFEDNIFDGAIFSFNGLMQIPKAEQRERALCEIYRVISPGAWFVFTTHDRERSVHQDFWLAEKQFWKDGTQEAKLDDYGDRSERTESGTHFMHVPTVLEMHNQLGKVGFRIDSTAMRSELARESIEVEAFSDDCRFWVVQKP